MNLKNVSLCMIVKNESTNLARALSNIHYLVGEIVIVDTGSNDCTVEIAKAFNANVLHTNMVNSGFAEARNIYLKHCTKDWILVLDADEYIPNNQLDLIAHLPEDRDKAYKFWRTSFISNQHWDLDWVTRLFPNIPELEYIGAIHEQIYPSLMKSGISFQQVDISIMHFGYLIAGNQFLAKQSKYYDLQKQLIYSDSKNVDNYPELILHSLMLNDFSTCFFTFEKIKKFKDVPIRTYLYMGQVYKNLGMHHKEKDMYLQGLLIDNSWSPLLNLMGITEYRFGNYKVAEMYFNQTLKQCTLPHVFINKALSLEKQRKYENAYKILCNVANEYKEYFVSYPYYISDVTTLKKSNSLNVLVDDFISLDKLMEDLEFILKGGDKYGKISN